MTNHTLEEIVAVEKEIQARLAEEQGEAAAWLAGECAAVRRSAEAGLDAAQRQLRQQIVAAEAAVGDEATELVCRAETYAARLANLPEQRLRLLLVGHLRRLLPDKRP